MTAQPPADRENASVPATEQDRSRVRKPARTLARYAAIALAAIFALIVVTAVLVAIASHSHASLSDLQRWVGAANGLQRWGLLVQCLIVAAIALRWKPLVAFGRKRGVVKAGEYEQVLALRAQVVAFLVAYLVLVPIGPTTLWRLAFGG